ncbi:hypothetical protein AN0119.2 [Aspergillus nidulans FGSC A4]|nr:hypothetical protein AN0119.2 [Aspergillus nidulans FGSC A4]|eukprot:XP_657723.1 hypothetical protein AN0119.2 [Aspergillus nidulans FGSC A4]
MEQINLLVFDEAHHTKKDHVCARIIRDSYFPTAQSKRPRVLGMTASPVDTKGDVAQAAMNLELYLDSKIATASQLSLVHQVVRRPKEEAWIYDRLEQSFGTEIYRLMEGRLGDIEDLKLVFRFAWQASFELGRWCSDGVLKYVFSAKMLPKLEGKSKELSQLRDASEVASSYILGSPEEPGQSSHKVQVLRRRLTEHYRETPETRSLVFTTRRYTTLMLLELFNALEMPHLRPGLLIEVILTSSSLRLQWAKKV